MESSEIMENWATPNTLDHLELRSKEALEKQATGARKGSKKPADLREQVDPKSCEIYLQKWRTPAACDGDGGVKTLKSIQGAPSPKIKLRDHVNHVIGMDSKKKLNPDWVESLMGLPPNTTQLSKDIGTGKNRIERLRLLGNGVVPQTAAKAFLVLLDEI